MPTEFRQNVAGSAINFFIPEDTGRAGDGAFGAWNIFYGAAGNGALPRVLSWADRDLIGQPQKTTRLELLRNIVDPLVLDPAIGSQHPSNVLAAVWQTAALDPQFADRAARNYNLRASSPVLTAGPFGLPPGHTIPAGCYLGNRPPAATSATSAAITVGGPGIFAYQWRINGGAWSAPVAIAPGVFPRNGATVRTSTLALANLPEGTHTLEVIGQDFAGNWQSVPTVASWLVSATPPANYTKWLAWYGITDGSDIDVDGLGSFVEYAFATDPLVSGPPPGTLLTEAFGFTFYLPQDAGLVQGHGRADIVYQVEMSETLSPGSWTTIAAKAPDSAWSGNVMVGSGSGGLVPISISAPANAVQQFLRIRLIR